MRLFVSMTVALTASTPAWAQTCPSGVDSGAVIESGLPVTIRAIADGDGFSGETSLIGQSGTSRGLRHDADCWYGGEVQLSNGDSRYFYRVAVDANGQSSGLPTCTARSMRGAIPRGEELIVEAVHPDDAYFNSADLTAGTPVRAVEALHQNDDCWYGGSVERISDSASFYVYKTSFIRNADHCPANAFHTLPPEGSPVSVAAIHDDAPEADKRTLSMGQTVHLASGGQLTDDCWFSGGLMLPDGTVYSASRVALRRADASRTGCPNRAAMPRVGERVAITGVHRSDAYASVADAVQSVVGAFRRVTPSTDGCWVAGDFVSDSGVRYRFSAVDVTTSTEP